MRNDMHHSTSGHGIHLSSFKLDYRREGNSPMRRIGASLVLLLALASGVASAKSLYVITTIVSTPIPIHAYDIAPDGTLTYQAKYEAPLYGTGMVGIAMDSVSGYLFCTYEDFGDILLIDATALEGKGRVYAPNATNLAGIVYDPDKGLLYCVDRRTPTLYSYKWDPATAKLTASVGSPFTLEGASAYGISLDETNDLLYVASVTQGISVYSTLDWRLVRTMPTGDTMTSVAVDPARGYLYYGAGYFNNLYLTQRNLITDSKRQIQIAPDAGVVGLGVDLETGYVYITTGRDAWPGGDDMIVYNANLQVVQVIEDIGNPTGLVIPTRGMSVNPLHLAKTVTNALGGAPDEQGRYRVVIGDLVTYRISFDDGGYNPSEVTVVDTLPSELEFVSATQAGTSYHYDAALHRYVWQNPPLTPGVTTQLELVCRVRSTTLPDQTITNFVTIDSDKTPETTMSARAITTSANNNPLNIRKSVVLSENLTADGSTLYARPGSQITYRISFDNLANDRAVSNVVIVDVLSPYVQFVSATDHGVFGTHDPVTKTYTWSYPSLAAGEARSVDLTVRLAADISPGVIIPNTATIKGNSTPQASKGVNITVAVMPLDLDMAIVGPSGASDDRGRPYVKAGDEVTYSIRVYNPSLDAAVTQITIVDELPAEVNVVTAASDFGFYDRPAGTYTWSYPSLAPGSEARFKLVLQVREQVEPNTVISNVVAVTSRQAAPSRDRADVVVRAGDTPPGGGDTPPGGGDTPAGAIQARLFLKPTTISRSQARTAPDLMAVVYLPEGYGKEKILDVPLVLTPGSVQATDMRIFGTSTQGKIMCLFDPVPMLAALQGNGMFVIKVSGKLRDGRTFVCEETITVTP